MWIVLSLFVNFLYVDFVVENGNMIEENFCFKVKGYV